ncbi:MAG: bifunctional nuclease family protein [Actinobacteria bacterium]|jgi:uncharacterized protein|nr:bifunctional nuclease family protein [Actinomycetota bacterium]
MARYCIGHPTRLLRTSEKHELNRVFRRYLEAMRLVELVGVRLALPANTPVLEIREVENPCRTMIISIGAPEATSIHCALEGIVPARPLTHDLIVNLVDAFESELQRVVITDEVEGVYLAELHLDTIEGPKVISCRPSDAVAIAVRTGAEIFVSERLLERNGQTPDTATPVAEASEDMMDEFREFIQSISPDDFA